MDFSCHVSRRLHEEHDTSLQLCAQLEHALGAGARPWPPPADDAELGFLLRRAAAALADEVARHFAFEERELFPRLAEGGDGELAELLAEEHGVIRDVTQRFIGLQAAARDGSLDGPGWQQLRMHGLELAERLASHAQKEELSLLPVVDDLLDEATDRELFSAYVLD